MRQEHCFLKVDCCIAKLQAFYTRTQPSHSVLMNSSRFSCFRREAAKFMASRLGACVRFVCFFVFVLSKLIQIVATIYSVALNV